MTEQEALSRMVPPSQTRPGKPLGGVVQIHVTRACDKACFACTQGSNLGGKTGFMTPDQFEGACRSLRGYFGIVGVFGGNPALSPHFAAYCEILRRHFPRDRCGLWCNHPKGNGRHMRAAFNPAVSNLNVHLDRAAHDEFRRDWPESRPFGLTDDSRHSPCYVALRDVLRSPCADCGGYGEVSDTGLDQHSLPCFKCGGTGKVYDEARAWELISGCDINKHWSAMIGVFRGELRAWFCEIAGAQAMLHQHEPDYPDTGLDPTRTYGDWDEVRHWDGSGTTRPGDKPWWHLGMTSFVGQVRKHCHDCGVPLRGHGAMAQGPEDQAEQVSGTHADVYKPKRTGRRVELVTVPAQLGEPLGRMTNYLQNAKK